MNVGSKQTIIIELPEEEATMLLKVCRCITENDVDSETLDFVEELKNNLNCFAID